MTTYLSYGTLESLLDTNWNTGVIAKPLFENKDYSEEWNMNSIKIQVQPAEVVKTYPNGKDLINVRFQMWIYNENQTNTDKMLGEVRRIINAKITNGWRKITAWDRDTTTDFFTYETEGIEVLYDFS